MKTALPHLEKVAIVCNITAGKGKSQSVLKKILSAISAMPINHEVFTETWPKNFEGFSSVWLVGGDGTLNYFINKYPDLRIPVALFKGGSGNDFAWKLYGNKSAGDYFNSVLEGNCKTCDMGICNGKYFMNGVGIGFDGEVVKAMGKKKILPGHLGYLFTVVKKIFQYKEREMQVVMDGIPRNEKYFMITIANGSRYGGGFLVAPHAVVDDGELDIILIGKIAAMKRLSYLPKVERGKHLHLPLIESLKKKNIIVTSPVALTAHLDGELMESEKYEIHILPNAMNFIY